MITARITGPKGPTKSGIASILMRLRVELVPASGQAQLYLVADEPDEQAAVIRQIRTSPASRHALVLAIADNASPAHVREALAAGADDYLVWPFDPELLLFKLEQASARGRLRAG
ncbi:DNA-binding response OmpR family regulator [Parvibaculum indicum]|uniref:response regulator n=1 Tax=Parvibaculum indicum TaxID=562969 RepID=UPI00141F46D1|nr:response regulator [Parvibaculum indicum]NIJ40163.1 DNA-binding response OmpR family regulator [Parvibaculum indicum]